MSKIYHPHSISKKRDTGSWESITPQQGATENRSIMASDGGFHYSVCCFLNARPGDPSQGHRHQPTLYQQPELRSPKVGGQPTGHLSTVRQEKFPEPQCRFIDSYFSQDQHLADWHGPAEIVSLIPPLQESLSLNFPSVLKYVWLPHICRKEK